MAIELNQENFDKEITNSEGIALVDFWAPWCGPCKQQLPIVEDLSKDEIANQAKIAKLNVDENPGLAQDFRIVSVPTLIIFKNGEAIQRLTGVHSKDQLIDAIENHL